MAFLRSATRIAPRVLALSGTALAGSLAIASCKSSKSEPASSPAANASATATATTLPDGAPLPPPPPEVNGSSCRGTTASTFIPNANLQPPPDLVLPNGFALEMLASVDGPRHLAALPNGDLLVGTTGESVYLVPGAESDGAAGAAVLFAKLPEGLAHGVAFARSTCTVYAATTHGIHSMPYVDGQTTGVVAAPIAKVRTEGGVGHVTTSLAHTQGSLYATVGSSCNACVETDPTRATVQMLASDGSNMVTRARRIRNAIAIAVNPDTSTVWAGGAGQDDLPFGHPYEFLDPVTLHPGVADYGWPDCEENRVAYKSGADCSATVVPRVVVPAYATIIGATFYSTSQAGTFAFPPQFRGLFLSAHGSWHDANGKYASAPRVVLVAMNGDAPKVPVDWNDPNKQLTDFVSGFQLADGTTRIGRPSGVAVGPRGSLFVADDLSGAIYRIRPK